MMEPEYSETHVHLENDCKNFHVDVTPGTGIVNPLAREFPGGGHYGDRKISFLTLSTC